MKQEIPLVTVIIPVKNGGSLLRECLSAVFSQQTDFPYEVLCVDSGSRDDSVDIIRSFPARLLQIDPTTFGHGRTRNLAIQNSHSPFVALITQDAVPDDTAWLRELIAPMRENAEVAGVFGRHKPHPGCIPSEAFMLERHFANFGADTTLFRIRPGPEGWAHYEANKPYYRFFSDNNAALRRSVWTRIPYRDVEFMEDQLWGADILEAGYIKAYAPRSVVRHSHNYSPLTQARRAFDEARFHREYFDSPHLPGLRALLREKLHQSKLDVRRLMSDPNESSRLSKAVLTLGRDVGQGLGWFLGDRYELLPQALVRRISQHHELKGDAGQRGAHTSLVEDVKQTYERTLAERSTLGTAGALARGVMASYQQYKQHGISRTLLDVRRAVRPPPAPDRNWWDAEQYRYIDPPPRTMSLGTAARQQMDPAHLVINWVVPPFGRGGGGHMTIFRTIQMLERMGHTCRVYVVDSGGMASEPMRLQAQVHEWFLPIRAPVFHLEGEMEPADIVMATAWQTAYAVRASTCAPVKAYFIQDYEPAFFSIGAEWQLAEDTYHFGFYGLTAGPWLEQQMREKYGMFARSFPLAVDHDVYYPEPGLKGDKRRVFAYMRPHTTRRGFQIVALALKKVKERFPDVEIHIAGSQLPPSALPFAFVGHGILDFADLRRVFSSCDVGVCLSFTNYSLLPQEMAACGCPVVDVDVESTRAAYPEGAVVLAPPNVGSIADEVCRLLEDEPYRQRQIAAGFDYVRELSWDKAIVHTAEALKAFALHATGRAKSGAQSA
ncbi:glycosyltransferase [Archangium gephyra]|uniref:glycosyltransferase n=1 Tax=Archangium gephyra TaxID=48 RepID=UPI0035D4F0CB